MKKLFTILLLIPILSQSQSLIGGNNIIKANLTAYALGNFGLTYERHIAPHLTLSLGINKMPSRGLPFKTAIQNNFSSSVIDYENTTVSNLSITPELRFYILGGMRGLYLAPYLRYTSMDVNIPIKYSNKALGFVDLNQKTTFSGSITSMSGGLMIGTQHQLFKKVVIDIWIVGGHYGSASGELNGAYKATDSNPNSNVSVIERSTIKSGIESLNPPLVTLTPTVTQQGNQGNAQIKVSGPWAGIRALGVNVGIRF